MDSHSIFIKEEPVWDGEVTSDEGPRDDSQHIKTEDTTDIGHGIDKMEQSSYSAAINMAHFPAVKKEENDETENQDNPEFGFVHVNVDGFPSSVSTFVPDVDPLQLSSCIKKEEPDDVKQEPADQGETSAEVSDEIREKPRTGQGVISSAAGCSFTFQPATEDQLEKANDSTMLYCGNNTIELVHMESGFKGNIDADHTAAQLSSQAGVPCVNDASDTVKDSSSKPFACTDCDMKFTYPSLLARHEKIHTGIKDFACTDCDKKFTQQSQLKTHKKIHTGIKAYACTVCDKKFTHQSHLTRHKMVHTGIKPYACTDCDKRFTQQSSLTLHKKIHMGIKPFACTHCDMAFTQSGNLDKHTRSTHMTRTPYSCDMCNKTFSDSASLTGHKNIHRGIKPFVCNVCDKKFFHRVALNDHKKVHIGKAP